MSGLDPPTDPRDERSGDAVLAELAAELVERIGRGEVVDLTDYAGHADDLRGLLPTIRLMAEMQRHSTGPADLGRLGDFRLIREIGRGGMGVVYEAVQVSLGRRVALKAMPNATALDPRHLRRFQLEAQVAANLNHPHIVPVFATGTADGIPYYAMQFIEGRDLARIIHGLRLEDDEPGTESDRDENVAGPTTALSTQGPTFARDVARIARQVALALEHAHAAEVLHRDIKPSNLLLDDRGHIWVTDFGLARIRGDLDLSRTGDALGTPRYMSPEQALGRRTPLDGRSDVYSLGVTVYELLTLRPAFPGDDRVELLRRITEEEPVSPRRIDPTIPSDLETIVLKAMAKVPADRYATASELAADLGRFLDDRPIRARRPTLADRSVKWMRRHRTLVAAASISFVLIALGIATAGVQYTLWLGRHNRALQAEVDRADRNALKVDRLYLAAQLQLARQAVDAGQFEAAQDLLDVVAPDHEDGAFAWRYLRRLARREIVRLPERVARPIGRSLAEGGRLLAVTYADGMIVLWDLATERPLREFRSEEPGAPCLSTDGRMLVTRHGTIDGSRGPELAVWETETGRLMERRPLDIASRGRRMLVDFVASDRVLACRWIDDSTHRYSVRLLDLGQDKANPRIALEDERWVCFPRNRDFFITGGTQEATFRDLSTGAIRRRVPGTFADLDPGISGDGRYLALQRWGGFAVLETDRETAARRYDLNVGWIFTIKSSPGGESLVATDQAGLVHLVDRRSGLSQVLHPDDLGQQRNTHNSAVFSPDGKRLALGTQSKSGGLQPVIVWTVATGQRHRSFPSPDQKINMMIFTPDSRSLIVNGGRTVRIWHLDPAPEPPSPAGHKDEAWSVAYSPDGKLLVTGSDDTDEPQSIKLWDASTGAIVRGWGGGNGTVSAAAFSPDGRTIATGHLAPGDNLRIWDASTGARLASLPGHSNQVRSVAFSADGRLLATGSRDRTARIWDVATGRCLHVLEAHSSMITSVCFAPDGRTIATADRDGSVRTWEVTSGRVLGHVKTADAVIDVEYAPDGATLATAEENGAVTIRDASTLQGVRPPFWGEDNRLHDLAFAPDGRSLATAGKSGAIRLWDPLTGQPLLALKDRPVQVNGLAFAPDGKTLAACSHDGSVKLWRTDESGASAPRARLVP